jgi:hypothetical protein
MPPAMQNCRAHVSKLTDELSGRVGKIAGILSHQFYQVELVASDLAAACTERSEVSTARLVGRRIVQRFGFLGNNIGVLDLYSR